MPLHSEHEIIGALVVRRKVAGRAARPRPSSCSRRSRASPPWRSTTRALFRELERKSRQLEVASRHKSEFLASMSHELRTPLNAVIGFSDVLLDRMFGELNERQEEYVRDIRDSGRHLLELINEILDLSKIEAGRMELELGAGRCARAARARRSRWCASAPRAQGVALDARRRAATSASVEADELKLKQVVLNLLTNAVKFTPRRRLGRASRRAPRTARRIVSVRDTGIGIAEEERERIFEAFQRGGRGARTSTEGTGLGLTLSRRIVELHGGRMWMESELGARQHVLVRDPAAAPPAERRRALGRAPVGRGPPEHAAVRRDRGRPALGPALSRSTWRTPATRRRARATARRASRSCARAPAGGRAARHPAARHRTAGSRSRGSRATRRPRTSRS